MKTVQRIVLGSFLTAFLWMEWQPATVHAQDKDRDALQIGIPDFPRRIKRELPPLPEERQIKLGILNLHPYFKTTTEYDDNVLLSDIDDKDDVIFTQTPAMGVEADLGDHHVEAGYGMEIVNFVKETEENSVNHMANALMELNFSDLKITAQDVFEKTTSRNFTETSARDDLLINTFELLGRYDRPKWALETGWRLNTFDHHTETLKGTDYNESILAVLGGYKILPKTLLLAEVDIGNIRYERAVNANQEYWQIYGGLRGDLTEKITMTAKLGFQERQLGDVPGQGPQSDFDGLVADVDFHFRLNDKRAFRLGYLRTVRTSTFANNSWYRQDRIFMSYTRRFLRKWLMTPRFGWQFNDYPESGAAGGSIKLRNDNFWFAGLELRYEIQEWLSTGLTYRFRNRNSNLDSLDFENNRLLLDVTFAY